jgi:hypothetical protein
MYIIIKDTTDTGVRHWTSSSIALQNLPMKNLKAHVLYTVHELIPFYYEESSGASNADSKKKTTVNHQEFKRWQYFAQNYTRNNVLHKFPKLQVKCCLAMYSIHSV